MDIRLPESELDLLAKLEEANRQIETDSRSLNSLVNHSRRDSDTSQLSSINDSNNNNSSGGGDKSCTNGTKNSDSDEVIGEDAEDDETHSWQQWGELVADWPTNWKRKRVQITALIRRNGIPHHFRALVWQLLCQIDSETPERRTYASLIRARSACEKVIRRDIARTYPEHEFFKEKDGVGQESLFNVMKAYSLHDREVGYCQGSAFIVGLLLMQMPEEETFAVLVHIMQKYRMRDMFKPSMAELGLCMFQLECLVQEQLPQLHLHFKSQNFHTTMYASGWFLTLFTTTLSLPLACRVMDVFLVDGMQIIFQISLALLTIGERDLIVRDMEGMLQYFQKDLPALVECDADGGQRLMRMATEVAWNSKRMRKLEKEYQTLKIKEQQEVLELKRLRTEVRQWRQRCELLEAESARLAQRLIQGQVSRAEEVETTFALETELSKLRNDRLDMMHNLEMAYEEIRMLSMRLQETLSSQLSSSGDDCNSSPSTSSHPQPAADQKSNDLVACLQDELVKVRLREAENDELIRDLQTKIDDLESEVKTLREPKPDNNLARIQEELMAVKLREAESNLSLKELRERIDELRCQWHNMLNERTNGSVAVSDYEQLEDSLMSARLNEIAAIGELKELNLKVIQLESQVQLTANQFRRQSEELKAARDELEASQKREEEHESDLKRERFAYADLESCLNEHRIQAGISGAEKDQQIAELKQRIGQLELKNDEMLAETELNQNSLEQNEQICDLQDKVVELKAQVTYQRFGPARNTNPVEIEQFTSAGSASTHSALASTAAAAAAAAAPGANNRVTNKLPTVTAIARTISISSFTNNTPLPTPDLEAWRWIE